MNSIEIKNLKVFAHHGVFSEETAKGQDFFISAKLFLDTSAAAKDDNLDLSVNYGEVCHFLKELMEQHTFKLIESVADYLSVALLLKYNLIQKIILTLHKPHAPIGLPFEDVSITVTKMWHDAYLGLGSNMGDSKTFLEDAITALKEDVHCKVMKLSNFIITKPYGYTEQADFLNGAVYIKTIYEPEELLYTLHKIESAAGRTREIHWGPRTLDLDILLFDDLITSDENLVIPHPDMENRDFVLIPLQEIAPFAVHPVLHKRLKDIHV